MAGVWCQRDGERRARADCDRRCRHCLRALATIAPADRGEPSPAGAERGAEESKPLNLDPVLDQLRVRDRAAVHCCHAALRSTAPALLGAGDPPRGRAAFTPAWSLPTRTLVQYFRGRYVCL